MRRPAGGRPARGDDGTTCATYLIEANRNGQQSGAGVKGLAGAHRRHQARQKWPICASATLWKLGEFSAVIRWNEIFDQCSRRVSLLVAQLTFIGAICLVVGGRGVGRHIVFGPC